MFVCVCVCVHFELRGGTMFVCLCVYAHASYNVYTSME